MQFNCICITYIPLWFSDGFIRANFVDENQNVIVKLMGFKTDLSAYPHVHNNFTITKILLFFCTQAISV